MYNKIYKIHIINYLKSLPKEFKHTLLIGTLRYLYFLCVGIFLPLYLFKLSKSIYPVLIYYLCVFFIFKVQMLNLTKKLLKKYSIENLQLLSIFIMILITILINFLNLSIKVSSILFIFHVIILGILYSFSLTLYWVPQHLVLGKFGKHNAGDFALLSIINNILSIVVPILSGIFIHLFGFNTFYFVFAILYSFSILLILLYFKKVKKTYINENLEEQYSFDPLFFFEGMGNTYSLVFFYVFLMFNNVVKWGFINSILNLLLIFAMYLVSKFVDNKKDYNMGSLGFLLKGILISIIVFSNNLFIVSLSLVILGLTYPLAEIPYFGYFYYYVKTFGLNKIFEREINLCYGRGLLIALAFINLKLALICNLVSIIIFSYIYYFRTRT